MFGLIKWIIIFTLVGGIWLVYDVVKELSPNDRRAFHQDAIEALDSGDGSKLGEKVKEKLNLEINERKSSFYQTLRIKCKNFLESFRDEQQD